MEKTSLLSVSLLWLAAASVQADKLIDFETNTLDATPAAWTFDGDSSNVLVTATESSGAYPGGRGIRTDESGASYAALAYPGPTITSLQADFLWDFSENNTPTLAIYAWDDVDNNGFRAAERTIGFGLDNDGQFELSNEEGELAGTVNFAADTWYRLTMTWSDADTSGNRTVTLTALDLTNETELGVVASSLMSAEQFGVAPSEWDGIAFRMTRGTIDNIKITSPPGSFAFIDATPTNTVLNSDPENFPAGVPLEAGVNYINDGSSGTGNDGLWTYRTDAPFAGFEGGAAFESDNFNAPEDAEVTAELITTVTLPASGTYEIVALFTRSNNRDIAARISAPPEVADLFSNLNALNADQSAEPLEIAFDNSFTNGRLGNSAAAYLGTVTANSANEDVRIFVNGLALTEASDDERTQYDGIAYRLTTTGRIPGLEITNLNYAPDAQPNPTVTLTWRKTGAANYVAKYSLDMIDWSADLDDSIRDEIDENPADVDHITVTFPLTGTPGSAPALFFRIEEN